MCRMRRSLLNPLFWCVLIAFVVPVSGLKAGGGPVESAKHKNAEKAAFAEEVSLLYEQINLKELGLTRKAFEYALKGYYYLLDHHWLNKTNILSICDLSQSSRNKRMYVLDLERKTVLINPYVAHASNSGSE